MNQWLLASSTRLDVGCPVLQPVRGTADRPLPVSCLSISTQLPVAFKTVPSGEFDEVRRYADSAFAVLERAAPEIAAEIRSLLTEVVFISPELNKASKFGGATSFFCFGAMFLNADEHRALVSMIDGLTHESAHAYLFSLSLGDPFVANKDDEFYHSPLRSDPLASARGCTRSMVTA